MTRIQTNVASLRGLRALNNSNQTLNTSLTRLTTGLKINNGKDNPSGLIAGETLRTQIASIEQSITNSNRASNVISTADAALGEVSSLLIQVRGLIQEGVNDGALSADEIEANQLQIDSALSAINRIGANTSFGGDKLLDGSMGFDVTGDTAFDDFTVNEAVFGNQTQIDLEVELVTEAEKAEVDYTGGALAADATIEISGAKGTEVLFLGNGADEDAIAAAINAVSDATGVEATNNAGTVELRSDEYGDDQYIKVNTIAGTFTTSATQDDGVDAEILVNGLKARTNGLAASIKTSGFDATFTVTEADNTTVAGGGTVANTVNITGGGATFQIGQQVNSAGQIGVGIEAINTARLGGVTGKLYELSSNGGKSLLDIDPANSVVGGDLVEIVEEAINEVSTLRGRLGALQKNVIEPNLNSLGVALENVSESRSAITDTDFAQETANLTRSQILSQAGYSALQIANQNPQSVLSLLG